MGAAAVQVRRYERTTDPKRMLTHRLLNEAIRNDGDNIRQLLPIRTATYLEYSAGATKAVVWNKGQGKTSIYLPLQTGWYVADNPFAISNGRPTTSEDPDALYLIRHQDREFSGSLARGVVGINDWRVVVAVAGWSYDSGVVLVGPFQLQLQETPDGLLLPNLTLAELELVRTGRAPEHLRDLPAEQLDALARLARAMRE